MNTLTGAISNKDRISKRNNIKVSGQGTKTVMLAHGFGCDQNMWRFMLPELEKHFQVVVFDYVGSGQSEINNFSTERYSTLAGYAKDIEEIITAFDLTDVAIVAHSVSSIIAGLASRNVGERIANITMVCPSPCFINNPPDYEGGFEREDLEELINLMDKNYIGWANYLAPLVMGAGHSAELIDELTGSFCSTDPVVAKTFAKATFFSDYRSLLKDIDIPVLLFQSTNDSLASPKIGHYMVQQLPHSQLEMIDAEGHCLHMTHPSLLTPILVDFIRHQSVDSL